MGIRLGLCCIFRGEPIKFKAATATAVGRLGTAERLAKLNSLCLHNSHSLVAALETVSRLGIGAFRILSGLLPLNTHPELGYWIDELPSAAEIIGNLRQAASLRQAHDIRLSFHPDQFVVLSSPREEVVASSIEEIASQAALAEIVGAETINIHAGGVYGDKGAAMRRFAAAFARLPEAARNRLTLENDDVSYAPADILPLCAELGIPMVYDVHHHRCHPDGLEIGDASEKAAATWSGRGTEPHFHISSPKLGWESSAPKPHADYIDPADFPQCWRGMTLTVDVEAKAKELAVLRLAAQLGLGE